MLKTNLTYLKVLEVWPLLIHHLGQELVLQSVSGYRKVDESGLSLNLWLVVRIGQLSMENKSEARVEETLFVPDLYAAVDRETHRGQRMNRQRDEQRTQDRQTQS